MNKHSPVTTAQNESFLPEPFLGSLLRYPDTGYAERLTTGCARLSETFPEGAVLVERFKKAIEPLTPGELEEHYTQMFDLSPECVPYVGIHAFGEQENKRRWFLCGLADRYKSAGFCPQSSEMPDHIAEILNAIPFMSIDERNDLVTLCLNDAVKKMEESLKKNNSPFALVVQAVERSLQQKPSEHIS